MAKMYTDKKGYKRFSDSDKFVHRWMAEKKTGNKLKSWEVVHHKDEDKTNFRPNNLKVMSRGSHSRHHFQQYLFKKKMNETLTTIIVCIILFLLFILIT